LKAAAYQKLEVPHAKIIEAQPSYVLKQWVEGTRADVWVKEWAQQGASAYAPQIQDLKKLLKTSAQQGAYIGDLNAKHLIWSEDHWVIIDSGGIKEGLYVKEVMERYLEKIPERWIRKNCSDLQFTLQKVLK